MGHGQYLVYGSKSSIFSECIIIFQILGNHVFTPCIPGSFQRILMVFHCMVSPSDEITTRHLGVYSKFPAFIAKTQKHANFYVLVQLGLVTNMLERVTAVTQPHHGEKLSNPDAFFFSSG